MRCGQRGDEVRKVCVFACVCLRVIHVIGFAVVYLEANTGLTHKPCPDRDAW